MNKILWSNPRSEYLEYKDEIDRAVIGVMESGEYILGSQVAAFETEFADYIGVKHALGVASGTDAIQLAIGACGITRGDEVITVSHTAVATVAAIENIGATPVLVDIDPVSYTMDVQKVESAITSRTKAIIPVHLYGCPVDLDSILELAKRHGIYVIEDCAQAHGARYKGKRTGSWGDIGVFSFYPTKNLGAIGDGGMIVTNHPDVYQKAVLLRQYGWAERYISKIPGFNSRLDPIQAAILRIKLCHLDENNAKRVALARVYSGELNENVIIPVELPGRDHVFHLYVVRAQKREQLRQFLAVRNITTGIHYPMPVHLQPAYIGRIKISGNLKITEEIYPDLLSLPLYPQLDIQSALIVIENILSFYKNQAFL